jgi:tRNA A-37 threonylcarbamoyl transferase component Bud32
MQARHREQSVGSRRDSGPERLDRASAEPGAKPAQTTRGRVARWFGSCFYACGRNGLPTAIDCVGRSYVLVKVLKHDFMACTGLYEIAGADPAGPQKIICKVNRRMHFCFVPLRWLGRIVTRREVRNLKRCEGIGGVPQVLARTGPTTYIYEYIEGTSLDQRSALPPGFFERLLAVLQQIHARGLVHFDLNKRGNVLVGNDGQPWIIDFQLSTHLGDRLLLSRRLSAGLRRRLQAYDLYHLYKHKRRLLPAELTEAEERLSRNNSLPLRLHRAIARPLKQVRRRCLRYLHAKGILSDTHGARAHTETNPVRWTGK